MDFTAWSTNDIIDILTPFVAPIITWAWIKWGSFIPSWMVGPLCVSLGTLSSLLAKSFIAGDASDPLMSVFMSIAGIGVRQIQYHARKQLISTAQSIEPPPPPDTSKSPPVADETKKEEGSPRIRDF